MKRQDIRDEIVNMSNPNILCELPTSFGKSKIAIEVMVSKGITIKDKILIVVPRLVLINNWRDEFTKWGYGSYIKYIEFSTYISFPKKVGNWDFVIFDECHHLSLRCQEALKLFSIKYSVLLSATVKKDTRDTFRLLFRNLGIYKVPVKKATEEGILPDPQVYLIPILLDNVTPNYEIIKNPSKGNPMTVPYSHKWKVHNIKNRKIIIKCTQLQYYNDMTSFIEWCKKRIHNNLFKNLFLKKSGDRLKWLSDQKTGLVAYILTLLNKQRTLTFCNSIAQTELLGTYCINSKNTLAKVYLDMFNKKKIKHITACNMLDEGVNLVSCRVGIYATLNSSERMITQKLGRILRHNKPIVIIPYFKNTRDEEIVNKMCENYNPQLVKTIDINELETCLSNLKD